jgi:hypothetical protein
VIAPEVARLDQAAKHCAHAEELARVAALCLPEDPARAKDLAARAGKEAGSSLALLRGLGATEGHTMPAPKRSNPLAELARVENSRAEALALLDALRHAHQLAEALDQKRGNVLETPIGGSAGLEWGDRLMQAVCGLELELFGPGDRVTGARE